MGVWYDFIFDNTYAVDAAEAEKSIRVKYPHLLHATEKVELAFKDRGGKGRDKEYFTSHRILIKDGKGVGGKRKNYRSVPYNTISAYSVQTSGAIADGDAELNVWSTGCPKVVIDFSTSNVDVFQVYQLLNAKVWTSQFSGTPDYVDPVPPNMDSR
jgi:hypothetical protein